MQLLKQLYFSTQTEVEIFHKLFSAKPSAIIVENTENSPNSSSYTIEYKLVRNSHLLSQKMAFSKVPQQLFNIQSANCSHTIYQAAINCSYVYCEGIYSKVLQTHTILFKCTVVVTGVRKSNNISAQNTKKTNLRISIIATKTYHNGSFFSHKKQCVY